MALSCSRRKWRRWVSEICEATSFWIFCCSWAISSWAETRRSTARTRLTTSSSSSTSCLWAVSRLRLLASRSASRPGSSRFSTSVLACSGTSGVNSIRRRADSRSCWTVACHCLSPAGRGGERSTSTSARMNGWVSSNLRMAMRSRPLTMMTTLSSGWRINLSTLAATPTLWRSSGPGFSCSEFFWVKTPMILLCGRDSSSSLREACRPTVSVMPVRVNR